MIDQMSGMMKNRWAAMSLAAMLTVALAAGCGPKAEENTADTTAPAAPTPGAPVQPGGPGGTMMNKPSTNPNGALGDAQITMKVKNALIGDSKVAARDINVDTKSQTVVLRGTQATPAAISAAVADAKKIEGVTKVVNQLTVKK
ncbi:MAG: BON domain-containing protein [Capsulimonas sp.]|uniref:BON domain-containing protein n=1 Tax=Capsulimonas sp. TaxID=2494211 RepID=UPI0032645523